MASPNLSEIVTTTLRNRTGKLADNVTNSIPLLTRLKSRGNVKTFGGGRNIVQELEYAENSSFGYYSGYETINIAPSDVMTAAEFEIKQAACAVTISGLEQIQNNGKEAIINLLGSRVKNAEKTMMNKINEGIFSDGLGDGGKQIGGLQLLVSTSPTSGTVGGIDRSTYSFWQNQATTSGTSASASNIQERMNTMSLGLTRNQDGPDLIVADNNYYGYFWSSLQNIQRITGADTGESGFKSLKFFGPSGEADVILGGGQGGACPTNTMYFLNTDYIHFRPFTGRNFNYEEEDRRSTNQDAIVRLNLFAGNMTLSNASLQGVLTQS